MSSRSPEELGTAGIGRLLVRMSVPAILAQLINVAYNIVDRIYIGQMRGDGVAALTGLGLSFPIIMLVSAFSALVGIGGSTRAAIAMGEGDKGKAERILGNAFSLLLVFSLVLTLFFMTFKREFLMLFGASGQTIGYADDYLGIYLLGTVFVQLAMGLNPFITAQGYATTGMLTVAIGALANIVLDPILIFGFGMGVKGAALATIVSQAISGIWVLSFFRGGRTTLRLRRRNLGLDRALVLPMLGLGLAPFIMQSTESLVQIVLNTGLQKYGGDEWVGAMTVMSSVMQIIILPLSGLGSGAQPIIAFNHGARRYDRVGRTFRILLTVSLSLSLSLGGLAVLFPRLFIRVFTADPGLTALTAKAMPVFFAGIAFMGAQMACQQTLLGLGQAKISIFIAMLRKIILLIPLALVLPRFLGARGVFVAEPIADCISIATAVTLCVWRFRALRREAARCN